jgi:hypothetical protein
VSSLKKNKSQNQDNDITECRLRGSIILSEFFCGIMNSRSQFLMMKKIGKEAQETLKSINQLKSQGIVIPDQELHSLVNRLTIAKDEKQIFLDLDKTNHESYIFKNYCPIELSKNKDFKRALLPFWEKVIKLIQNEFKKRLGYGHTKEFERFFCDVNNHNPNLLKLVGYKNGDLSLKNLKRIGEKLK